MKKVRQRNGDETGEDNDDNEEREAEDERKEIVGSGEK
jgi:hypothetical protein